MKLSIVCVGNKMPNWVQKAYEEYALRLPKELKPTLVELPLANRSKTTNTEKVKQAEGRQVLSSVAKSAKLIVLDVQGKPVSTPMLAKNIDAWQMSGTDVSLVIGGPDGLSNECKQLASELWSFSALTLPHPLVRIVLIEQLYRAWTITQNHPYHK